MYTSRIFPHSYFTYSVAEYLLHRSLAIDFMSPMHSSFCKDSEMSGERVSSDRFVSSKIENAKQGIMIRCEMCAMCTMIHSLKCQYFSII